MAARRRQSRLEENEKMTWAQQMPEDEIASAGEQTRPYQRMEKYPAQYQDEDYHHAFEENQARERFYAGYGHQTDQPYFSENQANGGYDSGYDPSADDAYADYPAADELNFGNGLPPEDGEEAFYREGDEQEADDAAQKVYPHSIFKPRTKKPAFCLCVAVNVVRIVAILVVLAGLAGVGVVAGIAKGYMDSAPTLNLTALDDQAQTSFIYDVNDNLICEYKGTENRVMVSIHAMPIYLQQAFIAVQDARFYTHSGVDIKRIVGAFVSNMTSSSTQGGSTITQQLIKNTVLSAQQSYKRKIQQAYLALQLEATYTKDQILQCYLNTIFLGENYYGVQVAAQGYFGKELSELTLRECAMLAGVTNSPYYYNPRKNFYVRSREGTDYPAITNNRTDYVLRCMYEQQFITWQQYQESLSPATANVLETAPGQGDGMYRYAHYVEYAVSECVDILLELNNLPDTSANRAAMENKLRTGGYRIKLALNPEIQETVESTLENWSRYPTLRDPSDKVYRSRNADGTYDEIVEPQAAAVVLDYRTGELKAIVGSRTRPNARKTLNRATQMKMPVGSSIKPLTVYAPALQLGASPASIVYNMPLPISGWKDAKGNDTWPRNYGGASYKGPETLRQAMMQSNNTSAAQALLTMVGVDRAVDFLHRMGVDDNHIDATPFGLSLGSSGITPLQMTVCYGVLANGGVYQEPISVLGISDSDGNVVWDGHQQQERRRVFSESTSWMIVDMLKTAVKSGTGTSAKISGQTVGGKTGTNSDQKGVFFAGMTGYYSSSVWIGHDNYKALSSKSTGSGAAAPLWQSYMSKIHSGLSNRDILQGSASDYGLVKVTTCGVSGQLATSACEADTQHKTVTDWWAQGTTPTTYCQMHMTQSVCTQSGEPASPYCPGVMQGSVLSIPTGHPLYRWIGTEYEQELTQYLGQWVVQDSSGMIAGQTCTWHNAYNQQWNQSGTESGGQVMADSRFVADARTLIGQAWSMMNGLDPASQLYYNVYHAVQNLQNVINANPTQDEITNAMMQLTLAMAGF